MSNTIDTMSATQILIGQIGRGNLMAISGGRIAYAPGNPDMVILPVAHGYHVEVEYNRVPDTYTVRRVFQRGFKQWVKGEMVNVYADQVGEQAYRASCYHDNWEGSN